MEPLPKRHRPTTTSPGTATPTVSTSSTSRSLLTNSSTQSPNQKWKIKRQRDNEAFNNHQFLDATATVHVGLFGARRLPEMKSLWRSLVHNQFLRCHSENDREDSRMVGQTAGGKVSSRHLRRRTGTHKPRRRHRFPRADGTIDHTRASENHLTHHGKHAAGRITRPYKQPCRRARRKSVLLKQTHSSWWTPTNLLNQKCARTSSLTIHNPSHWIPTHQWHAKRFHMSSSPLFSWSIPLIHSNRGSRAALRLASSPKKCTIQDATWEIDGCAILLTIHSSDILTNQSTNSYQTIVTSILQRICGTEAEFLKNEQIIQGTVAGEGLIYELDTFPMKPIGPATFLFGRSWKIDAVSEENQNSTTVRGNDWNVKEKGNIENSHVAIMVHPSIRARVSSLIEKIISIEALTIIVDLSTMPLSLLRIRGMAFQSLVSQVLSRNNAKIVSKCDTKVNSENNSIDALTDASFGHGSLREFDVDQLRLEVLSSLSNDNIAADFSALLTTNVISASNPHRIIIKSHQPNDHFRCLNKQTHNVPCSGWDIFCHPSIASNLFQKLVTNGACAIGLAEHARAELEACHPLPIFPRDYPDTEEGRSYWEGTSIDNMQENSIEEDNHFDVNEGGGQICNNSKWTDWAVIRACLEGSWGKIHTPLNSILWHHKKSQNFKSEDTSSKSTDRSAEDLDAEPANYAINHEKPKSAPLTNTLQLLGRNTIILHWRGLISIPEESNQKTTILEQKSSFCDLSSVVVVRGSFGIPFLHLLHRCGKLSSVFSPATNTQKRRRKFRPIIHVSPLSQNESEVHSNLCQQLVSSLSLPALLRCELYCHGKGTLDVGDLIYPLPSTSSNDNKCEIMEKDQRDEKNQMEEMTSDIPLGVVVAGGFSPSRGKCHGVGFIGASRVIKAMDGTIHGMGVKIPHLTQCDKMVMLKIKLLKPGAGCAARYALMSFLL